MNSRPALIVAILALIVSVATATFTGFQAYNQRKQLNEAKAEFKKSGMVLTGKADLLLYNTKTDRWLWPAKGSTVPLNESTPTFQPNIYLSVTNIGRAAGAVQDAGIQVGDKRLASDASSCDTPTKDCALPATLQVGRTMHVWFALSPAMTQSITCNSQSAQDGVTGYLATSDGQTLLLKTETALPISGYCAALPTSAPS